MRWAPNDLPCEVLLQRLTARFCLSQLQRNLVLIPGSSPTPGTSKGRWLLGLVWLDNILVRAEHQHLLRPELLHEGIAMSLAVAHVLALTIRGFHIFPRRGYYRVVAASNTWHFSGS